MKCVHASIVVRGPEHHYEDDRQLEVGKTSVAGCGIPARVLLYSPGTSTVIA